MESLQWVREWTGVSLAGRVMNVFIRMAQGMPYHTLEVMTGIDRGQLCRDFERMVGHALGHADTTFTRLARDTPVHSRTH